GTLGAVGGALDRTPGRHLQSDARAGPGPRPGRGGGRGEPAADVGGRTGLTVGRVGTVGRIGLPGCRVGRSAWRAGWSARLVSPELRAVCCAHRSSVGAGGTAQSRSAPCPLPARPAAG